MIRFLESLAPYRIGVLAPVLIMLAAGPPVLAQPVDGERPVPRFVSVRASEANVRAGPGERYPVNWKFIQPGVSVEIIGEWDVWRKIRDWEGQEGWIHSALLTTKRHVIVIGQTRTLYRRADIAAPPVVRLEPGMVAEVEDCEPDWCRVEVRNYRGWLRRDEIWGVYPEEIIE